MDQIFTPKLISFRSRMLLAYPFFLGPMMAYAAFLVWGYDVAYSIIFSVLAVIACIGGWYNLKHRIVVTETSIRSEGPFQSPFVLDARDISRIGFEYYWRWYNRGFGNYHRLIVYRKTGEIHYIPLYLWDKDEIEAMLAYIQRAFPKLWRI